MYCADCGHPVGENDRFCGTCGAPQVADQAPVSVAADAAYGPPTPEPIPDEPPETRADTEGVDTSNDVAVSAVDGLRVAYSDGTTGCPGLDVVMGERYWIEASPGETIVGRWMCSSLKGSEPSAEDGEGSLPVVDGSGFLVLTSKRLVGSLIKGTSIVGPAERGDDVAVFALPLSALTEVRLMRTSGRSKDMAVTIRFAGGALDADLDMGLNEHRRAQPSDKREGARLIVVTAAETLRDVADPHVLDRAVSGDWELDGDDLVARLFGAGEPASSDVVVVDDETPQSDAGHVVAAEAEFEQPAEPPSEEVVVDAPMQPEGWYLDSHRPGRWRWWDGAAWGITDEEYPQ